MADVRKVRRAEVYKAGQPAATLTREADGVRFAYLPEYSGPPLARTLPLGVSVDSPAGSLPPFFTGLLPEGRRLNAVRRRTKASADDELSLLLEVGADLVGDVSVHPEGTSPVEPEPTVTGSSQLSDLRFSDLLADAGFVDPIGMAGVQDKLSAGMITLPLRLGTGPAIIKIDPPDYPGAVTNEDYFLRLARRLKLPVSAAEVVHDRDGRPGLLVARFDRRPSGDGFAKLAVEDAGQLLGRYPADKYAVSSEDVSAAIASACSARLVAARSTLTQFAFAWLTGNGDLHAKNLSVLQEPSGEWRVAPIYDIPSTLPYGDTTMALTLQGADSNLSRKRFTAFGTALGLPLAAIQRTLDDVLTATEPMLDELDAGALDWNPNLRRTAIRQLSARRRLLAQTSQP